MFYVEFAEKTGKLSTATQLGWNATAMLDDLQNTGKLTSTEMTDIENSVRTFIGKRYPEVLNNDNRLINHSMESVINAIKKKIINCNCLEVLIVVLFKNNGEI